MLGERNWGSNIYSPFSFYHQVLKGSAGSYGEEYQVFGEEYQVPEENIKSLGKI